MEPEGSLPHSHVPDTCPYSKAARSSPFPHIPIPEDTSYFYPTIYAWVYQLVSFPQISPPKPCIILSPIRATCSAKLILLNFITRKIFSEEYISLSSSLYSFLHSPVPSSLLGPNIPLNTLF